MLKWNGMCVRGPPNSINQFGTCHTHTQTQTRKCTESYIVVRWSYTAMSGNYKAGRGFQNETLHHSKTIPKNSAFSLSDSVVHQTEKTTHRQSYLAVCARWALLLLLLGIHVSSFRSWHCGRTRIDLEIAQQLAKSGRQSDDILGEAKFARIQRQVHWRATAAAAVAVVITTGFKSVRKRLMISQGRVAAGGGRLENLNLRRRDLCWNGRQRWVVVVVGGVVSGVVRSVGRCSSEAHVVLSEDWVKIVFSRRRRKMDKSEKQRVSLSQVCLLFWRASKSGLPAQEESVDRIER